MGGAADQIFTDKGQQVSSVAALLVAAVLSSECQGPRSGVGSLSRRHGLLCAFLPESYPNVAGCFQPIFALRSNIHAGRTTFGTRTALFLLETLKMNIPPFGQWWRLGHPSSRQKTSREEAGLSSLIYKSYFNPSTMSRVSTLPR